jgi:type II secretory pathway component PulC
MRSIRWEYSLTLVFVVASVILLVLIAVQAHYGQQYRNQYVQELLGVQSAGFEMQEIPSYHASEQAIDDYAVIIERPLFFKGRRPIELGEDEDSQAAVPQGVPKAIGLNLVGIINTPNNSYALFNNPRAKPGEEKFPRYRQGEKIKGWLVKEIKDDSVIITANGSTEKILLAKPRPKVPVRVARKNTRPAQAQRKKPIPNPFKQLLKK